MAFSLAGCGVSTYKLNLISRPTLKQENATPSHTLLLAGKITKAPSKYTYYIDKQCRLLVEDVISKWLDFTNEDILEELVIYDAQDEIGRLVNRIASTSELGYIKISYIYKSPFIELKITYFSSSGDIIYNPILFSKLKKYNLYQLYKVFRNKLLPVCLGERVYNPFDFQEEHLFNETEVSMNHPLSP